MTVTSVPIVITTFLFGMHNGMVHNSIGIGDFSLMLGILHICVAHTHAIIYVSMHGQDIVLHSVLLRFFWGPPMKNKA